MFYQLVLAVGGDNNILPAVNYHSSDKPQPLATQQKQRFVGLWEYQRYTGDNSSRDIAGILSLSRLIVATSGDTFQHSRLSHKQPPKAVKRQKSTWCLPEYLFPNWNFLTHLPLFASNRNTPRLQIRLWQHDKNRFLARLHLLKSRLSTLPDSNDA